MTTHKKGSMLGGLSTALGFVPWIIYWVLEGVTGLQLIESIPLAFDAQAAGDLAATPSKARSQCGTPSPGARWRR